MSIKYGFFDSVDGDRKYTAEDIGRYLHGLVSSGVYADTAESMQVLAGTQMQLRVAPGRAMLDGYYMEITGEETVTLSPSGNKPRTDAVVIRLDKTRRLCEIAVLEGTPTNPSMTMRPLPTRTETVKEYILAYVYVEALAGGIHQGNIYDQRANNDVCGWVTGLIDQVDTSTLYRQWEAAYAAAYQQFTEQTTAYLAEKQAAFDAFMDDLTERLNVQTYIKQYVTNYMITTAGERPVVPINIAGFIPHVDVLFVNFRGLIYPALDYTLVPSTESTSGHAVRLDTGYYESGDMIELRVLKSKIGTP